MNQQTLGVAPRSPKVTITAGARRISMVLLVLSVLCMLIGIFSYMTSDLNVSFLQGITEQVRTLRDRASNEGMPISGTVMIVEGFSLPASLISGLMNNAVLIFLLGVMCLFNAIMLRLQSWERMKDLFCVEPALLFFLLFVYYPIIDLVRISFTDIKMLSNKAFEFVGIKNYDWLFASKSGTPKFVESLLVTLQYTFCEIVITLVGGMLLALLFNRMTRAFNVMRTIVFMPKYIAVSTSAIVFIWILNGNYGVLNYVLSLFGVKGPNWLNEAGTALTGVLFLTAWRVVGYAMMIYLSAMQGIPHDYYEAAAIDGADGVHRFRYITLPLLAPTTLFLFVTTFIASMKVFQSVDVMTGGGPGTATNVLVQWIYNLSFVDFRLARAAVVSVVFFVILLVCTTATMRYSNRKVNYDS